MSHITTLKTIFKSKAALIEALKDMGFKEREIEVHEEAQLLHGYDERHHKKTHKAEIIIRQSCLGNAYNDIGFAQREDGTWEALISDAEMTNKTAARNDLTKKIKSFGKDWVDTLSQQYSINVIEEEAARLGYTIESMNTDENGEITVTVNTPY